MAERRMFAKTIIDSDAFLEMPVSARLLYYDLSMRADDDGFVNSPIKIMRMIGASKDDLNILILRKFILSFDNGIIVIKHWRIHNYIRKDTYNKTPYQDEYKQLKIDTNKAYFLEENDVIDKSVDGSSTQVRLGKVSIDKVSIDNSCSSNNITTSENIVSEIIETVDFDNNDNNKKTHSHLLIDFWEKEVARPLTPSEIDFIHDFRTRHDDAVIKYAMKLTIANGKRNIGYLRTILNNYFANGLKTVVEIMQHEESRFKKFRSYHEKKQEMILPDYYTSEITHNESLDITNAEIESLKKKLKESST